MRKYFYLAMAAVIAAGLATPVAVAASPAAPHVHVLTIGPIHTCPPECST